MPDPVALSSAESEYNMACLAFMAAMHLIMLKNDLELMQCQYIWIVPALLQWDNL
jgi:hypothetical protein